MHFIHKRSARNLKWYSEGSCILFSYIYITSNVHSISLKWILFTIQLAININDYFYAFILWSHIYVTGNVVHFLCLIHVFYWQNDRPGCISLKLLGGKLAPKLVLCTTKGAPIPLTEIVPRNSKTILRGLHSDFFPYIYDTGTVIHDQKYKDQFT